LGKSGATHPATGERATDVTSGVSGVGGYLS